MPKRLLVLAILTAALGALPAAATAQSGHPTTIYAMMTITPNPTVVGVQTEFDGRKSNGGAHLFCRYPDIELHEWDLDGDTVYETTGRVVYRSYADAGTVPVSLRVTNNCSSATTRQELVVGGAAPNATYACDFTISIVFTPAIMRQPTLEDNILGGAARGTHTGGGNGICVQKQDGTGGAGPIQMDLSMAGSYVSQACDSTINMDGTLEGRSTDGTKRFSKRATTTIAPSAGTRNTTGSMVLQDGASSALTAELSADRCVSEVAEVRIDGNLGMTFSD
jgi:hypothetical protein